MAVFTYLLRCAPLEVLLEPRGDGRDDLLRAKDHG